MRAQHKKRMEASKRLLLCAGIIFAVSVAIGTIAAIVGADPTFFMAVIGITGGVFGSAIEMKPMVIPIVAILVVAVTLLGSIPAVRTLLRLDPTIVLHGR